VGVIGHSGHPRRHQHWWWCQLVTSHR